MAENQSFLCAASVFTHLASSVQRREENGGSDSEEEEDEEDEEGEEGQDDDDASGLRKERTKMLHRLRKSTRLGRQPQGMGRGEIMTRDLGVDSVFFVTH